MKLGLALLRLSLSIVAFDLIFLCPVTSAFRWEDDDSVVVEALTSSALLKRRGGKFPFTWPWESQGFHGRGRAENNVIDPDFTCYTTLGEQGVCATLRECYPMLYSVLGVEYGKSRQESLETTSLIDTLKSISGPCDFPNFGKFRIDMPDSLICCPSRIVFPEPGMEYLTSTTTPKTTTAKSAKTTTTTGPPRVKEGDSAVPRVTLEQLTKKERPASSPPEVVPTVPDAVAAHFHREYICGFKNESGMGAMSAEEASNRFPWIVALVGNRGHFCAGALIDRYNVLTSASCTYFMTSEDVSNLQVYLGDYKLHSIGDGPLIVRKVARIIYHRAFDNQTLKNDIAILRFKLPAPVGTERVLPVCLPKKTFQRRKAELQQNMLVGNDAILAGWGRNWNPSPVPVLRKATLRIWNNEDCRIKYGYLARSGITDHMLCAYPPRPTQTQSPSVETAPVDKVTSITTGDSVIVPEVTEMSPTLAKPAETVQNSNKNARHSEVSNSTMPETEFHDCVGDTGGPLIVLNEDQRYEIVGIVSWNIGCSHYPYIHTRVGSYLNWIEKNRHR